MKVWVCSRAFARLFTILVLSTPTWALGVARSQQAASTPKRVREMGAHADLSPPCFLKPSNKLGSASQSGCSNQSQVCETAGALFERVIVDCSQISHFTPKRAPSSKSERSTFNTSTAARPSRNSIVHTLGHTTESKCEPFEFQTQRCDAVCAEIRAFTHQLPLCRPI